MSATDYSHVKRMIPSLDVNSDAMVSEEELLNFLRQNYR
jgi:hypothetical protein